MHMIQTFCINCGDFGIKSTVVCHFFLAKHVFFLVSIKAIYIYKSEA